MSVLLTVVAGAVPGVSPVYDVHSAIQAARFRLAVTAAATAADDTLNVYVQSSSDDGATWADFVAFTQVLGNGGPKTFVAQWLRFVAPTAALHAPTDGSMSAGVAQGPIGSRLRVRHVIASETAALFSFSVDAEYYR